MSESAVEILVYHLDLPLYVIAQVVARCTYETVGRAKIPMAIPNMFVIPDQKMYFWKQKSLDLRNCIHAWTHVLASFRRMGDRTPSHNKFWREFVMNACVASFSAL